jgi:hypothetical protein
MSEIEKKGVVGIQHDIIEVTFSLDFLPYFQPAESRIKHLKEIIGKLRKEFNIGPFVRFQDDPMLKDRSLVINVNGFRVKWSTLEDEEEFEPVLLERLAWVFAYYGDDIDKLGSETESGGHDT